MSVERDELLLILQELKHGVGCQRKHASLSAISMPLKGCYLTVVLPTDAMTFITSIYSSQIPSLPAYYSFDLFRICILN